MNEFIKQQQELARKELGEPAEGYSHYNVDGCTVERLIEQAITNTGEELMRLADYKKAIHTQLAGEWTGISLDGSQTRINPHLSQVEAIDTLEKHITSLTGVE